MTVSLEQLNQLTAFPAVILLHQSERKLIMRDSDQGLDPVLFAAVEDPVIELQTLFVGLFLHAGGEDTGPVDGGAEAFEAHFGKEGYVFLIVVIKVNGLMRGI
jgi:hypothetical protein